MVEMLTRQEDVIVAKGFCPPYNARTVAICHLPLANEAGEVIGKGAELGVFVEDERGFRTYAQRGQLSPR